MNYEVIYHQQGTDTLTAKEHTHTNQLEIIQIVKGTGNLLLGKREYHFSDRDVFCFDGTVPHYISPEEGVPYERNKLSVEKSTLSLIIDENLCKNIYFKSDAETAMLMDHVFRQIKKHSEEGQPFNAMSEIFHLLGICYSHNTNLLPSQEGPLHTIISYINANLQNSLSMEKIAQHAHMSKYYMCRKFKQDTGTTIGHYIKHQRIYLAQKLLNETTKPIAVIALDCGFNDISHFTKAFKAFVKVTPSEYRRRKNQG